MRTPSFDEPVRCSAFGPMHGADREIKGYLHGSFDLIHVGDLDLIHQAKQSCTHLVVGVTTDEVQAERTGGAPVTPYRERVDIVAHVRDVDETTADDTDLVAIWQRIRFEVMFVNPAPELIPTAGEATQQLAPLGVRVVTLAAPRQTRSELVRASRRRLETGRAA